MRVLNEQRNVAMDEAAAWKARALSLEKENADQKAALGKAMSELAEAKRTGA